MPETKRSLLQRAATFARFYRQQRARLPQLEAHACKPDPSAPILLTGGEAGWIGSGLAVQKGDRFRVKASGHHWMAKGLGLVFDPVITLFVRIGGSPVRRIGNEDWVFEAWADGEVELLSKGLSEFADEAGNLLPGKRKALLPGIGVRLERTEDPASNYAPPDDWNYLWRIGEAQIFTGLPDDIAITLDREGAIVRRDVDLPLTETTSLEWDWLIENLPSSLPEDLAFTHDYISIAVEFENGRDLTYMWSAGLDEGHIFRCPLGWWCDWETHWVLRSGQEGLGAWHSERRMVAADYREALGEPLPQRVVRVWLIANNAFQRFPAKAHFRDIRLG